MKLLIYLFAFCITLPHVIYAQNTSPIEQQQSRIESLQAEQLRKIQQNADNSSRRKPTQNLSPKKQTLEEIFSNSPSIQINELIIANSTKLGHDFLLNITEKYSNSLLTPEGARNVLREITNEYVRLGYITCRAYLPPQDISGGSLRVEIIEGSLTSFNQDPNHNPVSPYTAFPNTLGEVVNLRDIEQGFEQINRLSSNQATMDIRPGKNSGTSEIFIKNGSLKRWHISTELNNYGLENTGELQSFTTFSYDNLLGLNDLFSFTHGFDPTLSSDGDFNQLSSFVLSIPYGYWTFQAGVNLSRYQNDQVNDLIEIESSGRTEGFTLNADRLFYRDQNRKLTFHTNLKYSTTRNFINGNLLTISSRQTSSIGLGVSALHIFGEGQSQLYSRFDYSHGVPLFGTRNGSFLGGPSTRFHKFNFINSYSTNFRHNETDFQYSALANIQYAPRRVFSSEQFNLGGQSSIRGFRNDSITIESGIYLRQEVSVLLRNKIPLPKKGKLQLLQPYLAYDAGSAFGPKEDEQSGLIHGLTLGSKFTHNSFHADLSVSFPLSSPDSISENEPIFGFSLNYSF